MNFAKTALLKGLSFAMSQPKKWHEPHGLVLIGNLKPFIIKNFGKRVYYCYLSKVIESICISTDYFGVGVDALYNPEYPENPVCLGYPEGHETSVAIIGMKEAHLVELKGYTINEFTDWLKYYPDNDQYSIGIRIQSLLYGGVSVYEKWRTADCRLVSIKSLMDDAIEKWREETQIEDLCPGVAPNDLLLHLAPSLIVLKQMYPREFMKYKYKDVLDQVFEFYESIMIDNEYWGFKGEAFATGHILDQYVMDCRRPKSLKSLQYMIECQAPNGKFNICNNNHYGGQVHAMKGLYACMVAFGFED
ncbi:hypothetical protein [Oceanirhabdus seepicola]|uniref:Uncharacterized protein n=1 Tax=Oceanirhabdus seepicola TaxID=2828781 RepID=A0A9J6P4L2_9CLOT|nr:hypothetical protein [Oceanirhabdus seepicola]MCM1991714.1 hypothetical protein [Oceanirhabdus seepicola]